MGRQNCGHKALSPVVCGSLRGTGRVLKDRQAASTTTSEGAHSLPQSHNPIINSKFYQTPISPPQNLKRNRQAAIGHNIYLFAYELLALLRALQHKGGGA